LATIDTTLVESFIRTQHEHTVLGALGIEITRFGADASTVEVLVSSRLFQHAGLVHGGVYVLLMESAASIAAAMAVDMTAHRIAGQEISASHVRAVTDGRLSATAKPLHQGRTAIVYDCRVVDGDGRLVSTGRCTIAVRPIG
jgi:1,4-dihydroxy-2-naphthoyl-CoA hydrolase